MNQDIIIDISNDLGIKKEQVEAVLKLLEDGNTIPFIARYRKELTGALDEENIRKINTVYDYQISLLKRKEDVIRLIDEKGLLDEELKNNILKCQKLVEVEDLYRPYKEKKKTKATDAINNGLQPLAKIIMSFPTAGTLSDITKKFLTEKVKTEDDAIQGAKYIIAEWISDNAYYRKWIRNYVYNHGIIVSKIKKDSVDEAKVYEMYYSYQEDVKTIKPHRILALNRAEDEKVLTVNISISNDSILKYLESKVIKNYDSFVVDIVRESILDSFKRLIYPSIEREIRTELTDKANVVAINNFSKNVESLLLQPPIKEKIVLAFDPGYVNGCKLAVIDATGKYLYSTVIKPFSKVGSDLEQSKIILKNLINQYNIDIVAIGNGTASRESEKLVSEVIKDVNHKTEYIIVSEAGASIYSTEKVAILEFPNLSPNERSAVSIGRRLQDPLSELVKIPPEGIGVGLYQHDVPQKELKESLDFVVSKAVNSVGVNINTASPSLLKYVSGITSKSIDKIIDYRNTFGKINSRDEMKKKKLLSDKVYEQAIGFLRITDGDNILDVTGIHPESYDATLKLLNEVGCTTGDIGTIKLKEKLENYDVESSELGIDKYTLEDIIKSLIKPNRDPRDDMPKPILKSDVLHVEDLHIGDKLQGTVRNVVDFGLFIDIGLHNDGLAHISKLSKEYLKHPSDLFNVGDIVDCYVIDIKKEQEKVSLSLIEE